MTLKDKINDEYFEWLLNLVNNSDYSEQTSYRKLLTHLHRKPFRYSIPRDENRALDGIDLRDRFARANDYCDDFNNGECSILEMMIALAIRCEEDIMDDPHLGDRTSQWFWDMIANLNLNDMTNVAYDCDYVDRALDIFLNRGYRRDGSGGLFRIKNCPKDLRKVEIWYQLCWYLESIT
jgi:hypothetical protein